MHSTRWTDSTTEWDDDPPPELPIVNPYAVIALVAALLLLFPIAIVFALISFTYPRGRGMAAWALILGCLQLGTVATIVLVGGNALNELSSTFSAASSQSTTHTTQSPTALETRPPAVPFSAETAPETTAPSATTTAPTRPANRSPCSEPLAITTGADGNAMVCSGGGGVSRPVWQTTGTPLQPGIHDEGDTCNPSTTTQFGQNSAGHVVQCLNPQGQPGLGSSGTWTTDVNAG
ncbi:hypothetical protein [Nocardia jejuensis]|uniref:hypothetical protein n=1 Tax=Nocardia jejuensis TaxID=328049 RepID=UPI000832425D|nr:hypothetical protein [Nocardia jejuensis]